MVAKVDEMVLSWSGGKDSALALQALREEAGTPPVALLTTLTEEYERVSMHGVRRSLLRRQAEATGLPLVEVEIPPDCSNEVYEARLAGTLASAQLRGVEEVAFGDLFLQDIRAYRESQLAAVGKRACFPLWGRDTGELARSFLAAGFRAIVVCVDPAALDSSFAGRDYDEALLHDLPREVDACGEKGEFHTFAHDGPVFTGPIGCRRGEVVERDGFVFCDLLEADS
ncbi:MAG TPA: hypothetical protein VKO84_02065 [Gaiellaceae bacterium]|nr:hypothetical protein [Gaiellaceae bacterium]